MTRRALADAVAHADVLHLSCHGEADPEIPLNSRVYLASGESMTMADLRQVRTDLTLAVLSACDTGVIGHGDYDEVLGLPAVLLAADFPALYAASPTLPASRLEQWAGSMPFASPDHWAGFCYVGT